MYSTWISPAAGTCFPWRKAGTEVMAQASANGGYICWAVEKGLKANTVEQYINSLETIHKLRNIGSSTCTAFTIDRLIEGAKNREQYSKAPKHTRKVMSLPLLKILGHEIASS
jgi:hypothetical protein